MNKHEKWNKLMMNKMMMMIKQTHNKWFYLALNDKFNEKKILLLLVILSELKYLFVK